MGYMLNLSLHLSKIVNIIHVGFLCFTDTALREKSVTSELKKQLSKHAKPKITGVDRKKSPYDLPHLEIPRFLGPKH